MKGENKHMLGMKSAKIGKLVVAGALTLATAFSIDKPIEKAGWSPPDVVKRCAAASPAVFDIDYDGKLELFTGGGIRDSTGAVLAEAFAVKPDGQLLPNWPVELPGGYRLGSVASVGDVTGDYKEEIVIPVDRNGKIYVVSGEGNLLPGWPVDLVPSGFESEIQWRPAALGDLDGDGKLEVVLGIDIKNDNQKGGVYALKGDGTPVAGWPVTLPNGDGDKGVRGAMALGDLDGDGAIDVVVPGKDGSVYAFKGNGTLLWATPTDAPIGSSPVVGDLDANGIEDVVVMNSAAKLYALKGNDGSVMPGFPLQLGEGTRLVTDRDSEIGVTLADLDSTGELTIFANEIRIDDNSEYDNKIYAINPDGTSRTGWPVNISLKASLRVAPTILDADGDGKYDIFCGAPTKIYCFDEDGVSQWQYPLTLMFSTLEINSPTFADLEKDGKTDMMVFGGESKAFEFPNSVYRPEAMEWPMYRHDNQRTGNYHWGRPSAIRDEKSPVPTSYRLMQNYPNPFNPSTNVEFDLPKAGAVNLSVYNILGQKVRTLENGKFGPGHYKSAWDGSAENGKAAPSGVYLLNLKVNDYSATQKMLLAK